MASLSHILNPTDGSIRAAVAGDATENSSEASTEIRDEFRTPTKRRRSSLDTDTSTNRVVKARIIPPLVLSPEKSTLYNRRASTSPQRLPHLPSPDRRDPRFYQVEERPPSPETDINRFSIFNALLSHAELTLEVAKHLDIEDLISLYAISVDFHLLVNRRFTALIRAQSFAKAAESARTFIHRCYKNLCIRDPALRPNETREGDIRMIPSFRWLRMILFREQVVEDIIRSLAAEGHRMPHCMSLIIKKLWFTIDISDNMRRIGLMHNERFWSKKDLFLATMFFIKLDMRLTDPLTGNGELGLRRMLLNQRSLSTLDRVLKREEMVDQIGMLRMIVRYNYAPPRRRNASILGVPANQVGRLQYEGWGWARTKFIPVDELIARESVRRGLNLQNHYLDMQIWGFVNKRNFKDVRIPPSIPATAVEDEDEDESSDEEAWGLEKRLFGGESEEDDDGSEEDEVEEGDSEAIDLNAGNPEGGAILENIRP